MIDSETLTALTQTYTEEAYVYQRADGIVERANSAAEVFNLCPVLREMAQENPEQANVLLELAAVGREKMEKESEEKNEPETEKKLEENQRETAEIKKPDSPTKPEIHSAIAEPQENTKPAGTVSAQSVETATHQPLEIAYKEPSRSAQLKQQESLRPSQIISKTEKNEYANQPQTLPKSLAKAELRDFPGPINTNYQSEQRNARPRPQETGKEKQIGVESHTQSEVLDTNNYQEGNYFKVPTPESEALVEVEPMGEDFGTAGAEITFQIPNINNEQAVSYEEKLYTDQQLEDLFDPETVEIYKELLALTDRYEVEHMDAVEPVDILTDINFKLIETQNEEYTVNKFEVYIAGQPIFEEPTTLVAIQEKAKEQPLEQSFLQLTELLTNSGAASDTEQVELYQILWELDVVLQACHCISQETEEPKPRITPELTEKLLTLLRHLGNDNPKEALVGLIRQYGLAFLLQALQYMCQLSKEANRKEFLTPHIAATTQEDNARLRVARGLLRLLSNLGFETAASNNAINQAA